MSLTGVFGEIIGAVCGLFVVNTIPSWHIPIIVTDRYLQYLPYANITIIAACITKILMYLSAWYRIKMVFEEVAQCVAIYSLSLLIVFFPFDFSIIGKPAVNTFLMTAFQISIVAVGIACIITFIKFVRGKPF